MSPEERAERRFHQVGVLANGAAIYATDAERELQAVYRRLQLEHPDTAALWTARVMPLREFLAGDSRRALSVLGAAVLAVLLVACVNVVALLGAWLHARRQEFLVRGSARRISRARCAPVAGRDARLGLSRTRRRCAPRGGVRSVVWWGGCVADSSLRFRAHDRPASRRCDGGGSRDSRHAHHVDSSACDWEASDGSDAATRVRAGRRGQQIALAIQMALSVVLLCAAVALLEGFQQVSKLAGPPIPS